MATHSMIFFVYNVLYTPHVILNGMFIKPSNITGYWIVYHIEILHSGSVSVLKKFCYSFTYTHSTICVQFSFSMMIHYLVGLPP